MISSSLRNTDNAVGVDRHDPVAYLHGPGAVLLVRACRGWPATHAQQRDELYGRRGLRADEFAGILHRRVEIRRGSADKATIGEAPRTIVLSVYRQECPPRTGECVYAQRLRTTGDPDLAAAVDHCNGVERVDIPFPRASRAR